MERGLDEGDQELSLPDSLWCSESFSMGEGREGGEGVGDCYVERILELFGMKAAERRKGGKGGDVIFSAWLLGRFLDMVIVVVNSPRPETGKEPSGKGGRSSSKPES